MKKIRVGSIALCLWGVLAPAGSAASALTEDFSTDSGLWTYTGSAYRDAAGGCIVLTSPAAYVWGQVWLNEPRKAPFLVTFRYRAGGGLAGGDGLVFMFHKSMDFSPTFPDYGGSLGFSKSPHTSLTPVPGYGVELDSVYNPPIYNDPSWNHIALIKDHAGKHLASVNDSRVADDLWHEVEVHVNDASVEVVVDGDVVLAWNGTIDRQNGGLGFSAATGGYSNWHLIDDFTITEVTGAHLVDNGDPGTSFTGYWQASGAPDPYGESSLYAQRRHVRVRAQVPGKGTLRCPRVVDVLSVSFDFCALRGRARRGRQVFVDQLHGGSRWNLLGNFLFDGTATVRILALGTATMCADAIQLAPTELEPPTAVPEIVLDGGDPGTTALGEWAVSGAPARTAAGRSIRRARAPATRTPPRSRRRASTRSTSGGQSGQAARARFPSRCGTRTAPRSSK